jgi:hypothetical protein
MESMCEVIFIMSWLGSEWEVLMMEVIIEQSCSLYPIFLIKSG